MRYVLLITYCFICFISCKVDTKDTYTVFIDIDDNSSQIEFALLDLKTSLTKRKYTLSSDSRYVIKTKIKDGIKQDGFSIRRKADTLLISAGDSDGMMYGLLELAEQIDIGISLDAIKDLQETPYIKNRGIKYNIPLDIRTSAFDDSGDAAQKNIATMWDFSFWKHFFDEMARNRYNVISYWNAHPFSSMLQLEEYPDVALQDVWGTTIDPQKEPYAWNTPELASTKPVENKMVLKKMTIEEKISFWQKVMQYAKDRGVDTYFVTWNICLNGAAPTGSNKEVGDKKGKYGITNDYKNDISKDYLRKSVKQFLLTYPHVKGIGVTAGENMRKPMTDDDKERWLWETYGLGILDAKTIQKDRKVNFIHRFWWTDMKKIMKYWKAYPDPFSMSFKYAKARLYSAPNPPFHKPLLSWMKPQNLSSWWNLRNDDIFIHRWGDPTYVSEFIKNLPYEETEGFQMGSDGYVWAKEFISKNPKLSGELEIDKHWYRFKLWGRLGYNPDLPEERFVKIIEQRFETTEPEKVYKGWKAASKIIPLINRFHWQDWDYMWQPETCMDIWNDMKDINSFIVAKTMKGSNTLNIQEYVKTTLTAEEVKLHTPIDIIDDLRMYANQGTQAAEELLAQPIQDPHLTETLLDMKAMGYLGNYYAHKIEGALYLEFFKSTKDESYRTKALKAVKTSIDVWQKYAEINAPRYKSQNMARVRVFDFANRGKLVEKDLQLVKEAKPYK